MPKFISGFLAFLIGACCLFTGSAYAEVEEHIPVIGKLEALNPAVQKDEEEARPLLEKETIISGNQRLPRTNDSRSSSIFFIGLGILYISLFISINRLSRIARNKRT